MCLRFFGTYDGALFPGRIVLLTLNLALPLSAAPPTSPTRPARGMSGFWIRQVYFKSLDYYFEIPVNEFYEFFVKRPRLGDVCAH